MSVGAHHGKHGGVGALALDVGHAVGVGVAHHEAGDVLGVDHGGVTGGQILGQVLGGDQALGDQAADVLDALAPAVGGVGEGDDAVIDVHPVLFTVAVHEGVHQPVEPGAGNAVEAGQADFVVLSVAVEVGGDRLLKQGLELSSGGGDLRVQRLEPGGVDPGAAAAVLIAPGLVQGSDAVDLAVRHGHRAAEVEAHAIDGLGQVDRDLGIVVVLGQRDDGALLRVVEDGRVAQTADDDVLQLVAGVDHQVDLGVVVGRIIGSDHEVDAQLLLQVEGHGVGVEVLDVGAVGDGDRQDDGSLVGAGGEAEAAQRKGKGQDQGKRFFHGKFSFQQCRFPSVFPVASIISQLQPFVNVKFSINDIFSAQFVRFLHIVLSGHPPELFCIYCMLMYILRIFHKLLTVSRHK